MDSFYSTLDDLGYSHFERNQFKLTKRLGSGYVGEVYEGFLTLIDHELPIVAKKLTSHSYEKGKTDDYLYNDVVDELRIGSKFMGKANYLIQFYGYSLLEKKEEVQLFILMEKTDGCDLAKYLYEDEFWTRLTKEQYETYRNQVTDKFFFKTFYEWGKKQINVIPNIKSKDSEIFGLALLSLT